MKIQRNSKGFTLIELLIVIAIVGILAAIAIPQYMGYTRKTKVSEVVHSMGAVKNAIIAYYTEAGQGPGALANGAAIGTKLSVTPTTRYAEYTTTGCGASGDCTLTATFTSAIYSGFQGLTIALRTSDYSRFTWLPYNSGSTMEDQYIPKN